VHVTRHVQRSTENNCDKSAWRGSIILVSASIRKSNEALFKLKRYWEISSRHDSLISAQIREAQGPASRSEDQILRH